MNKIAKIFVLFLTTIIILADTIFAVPKIDCSVSYKHTKVNNKYFESKLILSLTKGWKLAQLPKISVLNSKNIKNCVFDKEVTKSGKSEYQ
ncbi:MAG: hypothetical protein IJ730_04690, partial [Alphaproteobacteria bacterium]|nr:hypothetical protein [Alphaproteobacteria bacterium]